MNDSRHDVRGLWILSACQALFMSTSILTITIASVAARDLLDDPRLATLPQAVIPLVAMAATVPAAMLMRRTGRKSGFLIGAGCGVASGVLCGIALWAGSYALFLAGVALLGIYQAFATYYRFAAADEVPESLRARSVSFVLAGGVVAAVLGPTLGSSTRLLVPTVPYLGGYLATIALNVLAIAALAALRQRPVATRVITGARPSWSSLLWQPRFVLAASCCGIGQGTMMLVMTATPLAMLAHGHSLGFASLVISWHVLAMFVPSFFSGRLIARFGLRSVLLAGLVLMAASAGAAISGTGGGYFTIALVLSGLAWNFLFVGGSTLLAGIADPDERALVQGANEFVVFALTALATFASGAIFFAIGWAVLNVVSLGALVMLAALLAGLGGRPFEAREQEA